MITLIAVMLYAVGALQFYILSMVALNGQISKFKTVIGSLIWPIVILIIAVGSIESVFNRFMK